MDPESLPIPERGLLTLSEAAWSQAVLRAQVTGPLAALPVVGRAPADDAAERLGLSRRWIYRLVKRYRQGLGRATDLAPGRSDGGRGKGRLPEPVERLVRERLRRRFLSRPKCTLAALHRDIAQVCRARGLPVPTRNTVALRIAALDPREVARKRDGAQAARPLQAAAGAPPETAAPLDRVQIDHTPVDLIEEPALDLSHLLPSVQAQARLPTQERMRHVRAERWIGYPRALAALERLATLFAWPRRQRTWLLDRVDPDPDPGAYDRYVGQFSVLLPAGRHPSRAVPGWAGAPGLRGNRSRGPARGVWRPPATGSCCSCGRSRCRSAARFTDADWKGTWVHRAISSPGRPST